MSDYEAGAGSNARPAVTSTGNNASLNHGVFNVATALALNDTIKICKLPPYEAPVDLIVSSDALDTGSAIVFDVGILDTVGATSDPDAFISGATIAQAGGVARMDQLAARKLAPVNYERFVVITVTTGPTTGATDVEIEASLLSRQADQDD